MLTIHCPCDALNFKLVSIDGSAIVTTEKSTSNTKNVALNSVNAIHVKRVVGAGVPAAVNAGWLRPQDGTGRTLPVAVPSRRFLSNLHERRPVVASDAQGFFTVVRERHVRQLFPRAEIVGLRIYVEKAGHELAGRGVLVQFL